MAVVCIRVYKYRLVSLYNVSCVYAFRAEQFVLNNILKRYFGSVGASMCDGEPMGMARKYICQCDLDDD